MAARDLNKHLIAMPAPPEMEDDTPAGAAARAQVSAHLATMGEEFASIGVQLGARYDGSPIVAEDGAPPADDYLQLHAVRRAGRPRAALLAGPGPRHWRLAVRPVRQGLHAAALRRQGAIRRAIEAAAQQRGVPLTVLDVPAADARELYGRDLALIRPDQYVAWRGDRPPADPDRLIARRRSARPERHCHARRFGQIDICRSLGNQSAKSGFRGTTSCRRFLSLIAAAALLAAAPGPRAGRLSEPSDQADRLPAGRRRRRHRLADHRRKDVEDPRPAGRGREQGRPVRQPRHRVRLSPPSPTATRCWLAAGADHHRAAAVQEAQLRSDQVRAGRGDVGDLRTRCWCGRTSRPRTSRSSSPTSKPIPARSTTHRRATAPPRI